MNKEFSIRIGDSDYTFIPLNEVLTSREWRQYWNCTIERPAEDGAGVVRKIKYTTTPLEASESEVMRAFGIPLEKNNCNKL